MKTPRQILFQQHEAIVPKLDRLRAKVVRQQRPRAVEFRPCTRNLVAVAAAKLWSELIWPCRRIWAGLAAVWITLLGVHLATRPSPRIASSAEFAAALEQRRQLLAELVRPLRPPPVEPPPLPPQARGSRLVTRRIV